MFEVFAGTPLARVDVRAVLVTMSKSVRRRVHFAMPFVVVTACTNQPLPANHHPERPHDPVASTARPRELVDRLPPLAQLDPSVNGHPRRKALAVRLLHREPDGGTSVRFELGDARVTREWIARIDRVVSADSKCVIDAIGAYEIACTTALPPEAITGHTVSCEPPPALAAALLAEDCRAGVASCDQPPPPPSPLPRMPVCPPPGTPPDPGGPICNPPRPGWIAARILTKHVQGDRMIVAVARGSTDAVTSRARCRVPSPYTCMVVRVDKHLTHVTLDATADQVNQLQTIDLETSSAR